MEPTHFHVLGEWSGKSIQEVISIALSISKGSAKKLLDSRVVFINNKRVWMAKFKVKGGDYISVHTTHGSRSSYELSKDQILFQDDDYIAINKPAGYLSNGEKSCESILRKLLNDKNIQAIHRLDKDTSGCLLFAYHQKAWDALYQVFKERSIDKTYHVLSVGRFHGSERIITAPIDGKEATTKLRCLKQMGEICLLEAVIETGRTHQIRKHLLSIGLPVLGDKQYTSKRSEAEKYRNVARQMLHAKQIEFVHPTTKKKVVVTAEYPEDFTQLLKGDF